MTQQDTVGVVGGNGKARKPRARSKASSTSDPFATPRVAGDGRAARGTEQGKASAKPRAMPRQDRLAIGVAVVAGASTVVCSMVLNVAAFTAEQGTVFGYFLGVAVPLWVLAATYIGQHMHHRCHKCSYGAYALAGFLLVVSLPHLAAGYTALGLHLYEGWALAVVTDCLQVVCKVAVIRVAKGK